MSVTLTFVDGPIEPSRPFVLLNQGESIQIGRRPNCDLFVSDPSVSGKHFSIQMSSGDAQLTDLGSRNGTRINGKKVVNATLKDQDEIHVGETRFRIGISRAGDSRINAEHLQFGDSQRVGHAEERLIGRRRTSTSKPISASQSTNRTNIPLSATINVQLGNGKEDEIRIRCRQTIVIGSSAGASDVSFANVNLRRRHFRFECGKTTCKVKCCDQQYPVLVNGHEVLECRVFDGDVVLAGDAIFRISLTGNPDFINRPDELGMPGTSCRNKNKKQKKVPSIVEAVAHSNSQTNAIQVEVTTKNLADTDLVRRFSRGLNTYVLVDFFRMGQPSNEFSSCRISDGSAGTVGASLIPINSQEQLERWSERISGSDCGVFLFSQLGPEEFKKELCSIQVNDQSLCDVCWPSILRIIITSSCSKSIDRLFGAVEYAVVEDDLPSRRSVFCNSDNVAKLGRYRMVVESSDENETEETKEPENA